MKLKFDDFSVQENELSGIIKNALDDKSSSSSEIESDFNDSYEDTSSEDELSVTQITETATPHSNAVPPHIEIRPSPLRTPKKRDKSAKRDRSGSNGGNKSKRKKKNKKKA